MAAGRQAYVVAARIDETTRADEQEGPPAVSVIELSRTTSPRTAIDLRLGLMHGRLPAEEKDAVMAAFRDGQIDVLVCTTVIEVGVDVPNATVMVVMDADRFGISQLHQLRGRIGRGAHESRCLLATKLPETSKAGERLKAVAATVDGFALADLDLRRASRRRCVGSRANPGAPVKLHFLSLFDHLGLIEEARSLCESMYDADPHRPGMAVLAGQFTDTNRLEYLDKS